MARVFLSFVLLASAGATQNASASTGLCATNQDCVTATSTATTECVVQADGYYSQCIDCAQTSFEGYCQAWSTPILVAALAQCQIDSCPGRCPGETDKECQVSGHASEVCVIDPESGKDQCLDCSPKTFSEECFFYSPSFLRAAELQCGESCPNRCPNHTDAECDAGQTCVVQTGGYYDQCIDCSTYLLTCIFLSDEMRAAADATCGEKCVVAAPDAPTAEAPAATCKTDKDCVTATSTATTKCVIQADGYYSQCIDCAVTSYQSQCQSWSTAILLEAELVCQVPSCPGKCPHETDAECQVPGHASEACVIEPDTNYNQCVDCSNKTFAEECFFYSPQFLLAAELKCQEDCTGRCPNHTDSECPAGQTCVVQEGGYFDECIDCTPTAFSNTCPYLSADMLSAAEAACGLTCVLRAAK
jgi:hypothetical protein